MRRAWLLTALLAALLLFAGCGGRAEKIAMDGSTSVEKAAGSLGEAFEAQNPEVRVTYNPTGSGAGIAAVAQGRCDIGLSSRALREEEKAQGLRAMVLAHDGIAIVIHPDNPVRDMSAAAVTAVFRGEIDNWRQLGGADAAIVRIGREAGSGTRDGFESITKTKGKCKYRQELTSSGDVITAVSQNPQAIGYVSLSAVKGRVQVVSVDGVAPSEATIKDGSYVIQRDFIFVTRDEASLSPAVKKFLAYASSPAAVRILSAAGVVAAH